MGTVLEHGALVAPCDFQIVGPSATVPVWLTDHTTPVYFDGGYGGHTVTPRIRKRALTDWTGRNPFTGTMPLLLYRGGASVEADKDALEVMATGRDDTPTPTVKLGAHALLPAVCGQDWFVEDLDWSGDEQRLAQGKTLIWKLVTVTVLESVQDTLLGPSTLPATTSSGTVKHYTVKAKDTMQSIAARQLGNQDRWVDIAVLNGLRGNGQLKAGMVLTLP